MERENEIQMIDSEQQAMERLSAETYQAAESAFDAVTGVEPLSPGSKEATFLAEYLRAMGQPLPEQANFRLRTHDREAKDGSIGGSCKIWSLEPGEGENTKPVMIVEDTQVDTGSRLVLKPGEPAELFVLDAITVSGEDEGIDPRLLDTESAWMVESELPENSAPEMRYVQVEMNTARLKRYNQVLSLIG